VGHITVPYHLDELIDPFPVAVPDGFVVKGPRPKSASWDAYTPLYTSVAQMVFGTENAILWTGDCSLTLAAVAGLQRRGIDPAVVWIDAHGDFNTPQTTQSGYLGGMPLAMLTQRGEVDLPMHIGLRAVPDERVILAGTRSIDPPEAELLAESRIHQVGLDELSSDMLPSGSIFLHVDVDVLDAGELPGARFAAPGGASLAQLSGAIERVAHSTRLVAVHLAFTVDPAKQDGERTAAVASGLVEALRRGGFQA
jgi:arginase